MSASHVPPTRRKAEGALRVSDEGDAKLRPVQEGGGKSMNEG